MTRRLEMALTRIFRRPGAPPSPAHRDRLEADLIARFGGLHPHPVKEKSPMTRMLWRASMVAGLVLAAAGASQVPADYVAEIGKRITVETDAPLPREQLQALLHAVEGRTNPIEVRVRGIREGSGPFHTVIELLGDTVAVKDLPATIRAAVPALAALPITVEPIERTVEADLGDRVRGLVRQDHLPPDVLRQLIEDELRAANPDAKVQVHVEDGEGRREVRVEVKKEAP